MAKGSLFELETQLELAKHLAYLDGSKRDVLVAKVNETGRLLSGLMRAFRVHPPNELQQSARD